MRELWSHTIWPWQFVGLRDVLDIIIVAILIYELLRLVHGTRAVQMAVGLVLIGLLYELSSWLGLSTVQWVLRNAVLYLGFAVIVLFQHEIRSALTHLGHLLHDQDRRLVCIVVPLADEAMAQLKREFAEVSGEAP